MLGFSFQPSLRSLSLSEFPWRPALQWCNCYDFPRGLISPWSPSSPASRAQRRWRVPGRPRQSSTVLESPDRALLAPEQRNSRQCNWVHAPGKNVMPSCMRFHDSDLNDKINLTVCPICRVCYMSRPSHRPRFHNPNNIFWTVQIMKLLIT
jgi:hypothetical protein